MLLRRSLLLLVLVCLGCSAQSVELNLSTRIERQVRATYSLPSEVKITVGEKKPSEFPNYDAVTVTIDGNGKKQDYDFLISKDTKTLVRLVKMNLSKDPYAEVMKKIDTTGRPVRGNKDAKVVAVNFDDFQCPFCSKMHQTLFPTLLKEYGDRVAFIYKDFPLTEIHPWATHAAVNANCLAAQNTDAYWEFADYMHANQRNINGERGTDAQFSLIDKATEMQGQKHSLDITKLQACMKAQNQDAIKSSQQEGETLGITATPTMFVNGQEIDGALPIEQIRAVFDSALKEAGVTPPAHPSGGSSSQ
ncbi:MAG TPA: thioredoxin domain-containing protein [Terriglobales bacterium]|jgi:protein-disulfide isomerase